jgi:hypothetical protein
MEICLHQFIRPPEFPKVNVDGVGDCSICEKDEDNKNCKCYCPINIEIIEKD